MAYKPKTNRIVGSINLGGDIIVCTEVPATINLRVIEELQQARTKGITSEADLPPGIVELLKWYAANSAQYFFVLPTPDTPIPETSEGLEPVDLSEVGMLVLMECMTASIHGRHTRPLPSSRRKR